MSSAAPFTVAIDFVPDDSHRLFHGTVTITKTTLTVFKTGSAATTRDPATNERATFIGVCSLPLIQFYRSKNTVTLMRGSSFLFDNAAVTAGLRNGDASIRSTSSRARADNPTMWETLQLRCSSLADCDRIVEVLLSRNAEETFHPPQPRDTATPGSTTSSVGSYSRHNEQRHHSRPRSSSGGRRHATPPATDVSTPRSSRLPSRRENDDMASRSSVTRTDVSTPRSSRLPSRRENDDVTSVTMTTPSQSFRSSQQRVAPGRATANATAAGTPNRTSPKQRPHSASHRRAGVDPAEREFASDTRPRSNGHPSTTTRSPHRNGRSATTPPRSSRHGTSPRAHSSSHRRASPRADTHGMSNSASVSLRSTVSRGIKTEQDVFIRNVQKMQHHRLHFMLYLHKEMVHQAYLVEEAKLRTAAEAAANGFSRRRTGSAPSSAARRPIDATTTAAEEAGRLREMENRLAQVEALHHEAAREREEAARLRREYEWKTEELNARLGSHPMAEGSRGVSVNSSVNGPHRNSSAYANGQLMVVPQSSSGGYPIMQHAGYNPSAEWALMHDPAAAPRPDDVDLGTAIIDRYVFGEEWGRVYPAYEADIRFNAQIDVCLAMKLPRRLVTITNLVVDRPGMRVTAEIRYDRAKIERDGVERRMNGCPFRFLQRFYDARDLYDPMHDGAAALTGTQGGSALPRALTTAAAAPRRNSRAASSHGGRRRRPSDHRGRRGSDATSVSGDVDPDGLRDHYEARVEDRVRAAEDRLAKKRRRMLGDLRRQLADNIAQLANEEEYMRDSIDYAEAKERQRIGKAVRSKVKETLSTSMANLDEEERVGRAAVEVGAARQMHVLLGGHRRALALMNLRASEQDRRKQIAAQEAEARGDLNTMMNPAWEAQRKEAGRRARGEELRAGHAPVNNEKLAAAMADLISDEIADRAVIRSQAMAELLDVLYRSPPPLTRDGRRAPSSIHAPPTMRALARELIDEEADERRQLVADEQRRRRLYRQDDVVQREMLQRVAMEGAEMDAWDGILDGMLSQNREQLERRLSEREQLASLVNEEQFYRRTVLSDEQDAFEVIAELFAAGLKNILTHVPEVEEEDEDLRRRRVSTQRQAKPFHYMTFSPEDMDYPPSAVLAIEGMVGCAINKNLEVVSVARPLPKAEEEDLQLQAGDMILDVAGHSLHSLSHLREVLSNRALQIQEEALQEFPNVPQDERTTNPALQKYIEVLCEHHNFLVQVLRSCEIFQIIVRS
ncbi:putative mitochondrial hypothetical protein [Leptomonas pyrrhocoris]|uniref:PDZ domain-containing protein n=1 Tax=Leptomonas pyrrhocoris TaxID=157538 RepID=A0A0M9FTR8_LEPPY|nr:putative mitochondrial hypothetical protein [Leptomonas pyrrhocoris]XP_015654146.1 putative mitochondrial hypothetical protein [Leptomonas pyrrhocoris]KPA75706.1 putative mitochondrial hypothetical protein [Leptomonas pyrrhocoris]KPA75707.1 putative mitochondrial hypothetical protein [Leptomonas pyrrhocoris]|eukprot:XP_015654145.1 putative mitochondrial hypothetical protein [Leptomonas pyrrhocoris]